MGAKILVHGLRRALTVIVVPAIAAVILAAPRAQARVFPFHDVLRLPVSGPFATNNCPEVPIVDLQGEIVEVVTGFFEPDGGSHGILHVNNVNITGTAPDGSTYRVVGAFNDISNFKTDSATTFTGVFSFNFVGQGTAPNAILVVMGRFTITPQGNITGEVGNVVIQCN